METVSKKSVMAILLVLFVVSVNFAQAPLSKKDKEAEKILENYVSAIGGEKTLAKIKSIESFSVLTFIETGLVLDRKIVEDHTGNYFIKVSSPETGEITRGFDGLVCWEKRESGNRIIEGEEKNTFLNSASLLRFANWKKLLTTFEYKGLHVVDGKELHKIFVETIYGAQENWYFGKSDFLLTRIEEPMDKSLDEATIVTTFEDYREVNGVKHAFTQYIKMPGRTRKIVFSGIVHNHKVDKEMFSLSEN
jgi:zinc protease